MPRVLVLDGEKLIRWSLKQLLSEEGHEVDTAATADEALRLAETRNYALIITDLEICGEQAKTFYGRMLSKQEGSSVIVLTALAKDQAEKTLADFKTFLILEKPFASEDIKSSAKKALGAMTGGGGR